MFRAIFLALPSAYLHVLILFSNRLCNTTTQNSQLSKKNMKQKARLSALILLADRIERLLRSRKRRSTNLVVDDAIELLHWINKKIVSRGYRESTLLTIVDRQTAVELGISERRAKKAKALLKEIGAIHFYKKTRSGEYWTNLWSVSIEHSRAVYVTNGYYRVGGESRYRSSKKKMSYEFVAEENNIFTLVKDESGTRSIFRKHRKIFEKQCLNTLEKSVSALRSAQALVVKAQQSAHNFIEEYFEVHNEVLIDF